MLRIDPEQCASMALILSELKIKLDTFTDPRFYPPKTAENELVASYFFFMVAIDHRTSIGGRTFEGVVEGEYYRGADLLYRLGALKWSEDPEFFTAERMAHLTLEEARRWLSVRQPRPMVIPGLEERVALLRDTARRLLELYNGSVMELYRASEGRLLGERGLLRRLEFFKAYEDPIRKKSFLLVKFLLRRGIWHFADLTALRVPVDNHLTRIALRYGIVRVLDHKLKNKLISSLPATAYEDQVIRKAVREAYAVVVKQRELDPTVVDDILWNLGRSCCWLKRERPACRESHCVFPKCTLTRILKESCEGLCPLSRGCLASMDDRYLLLKEPNYRTWYY